MHKLCILILSVYVVIVFRDSDYRIQIYVYIVVTTSDMSTKYVLSVGSAYIRAPELVIIVAADTMLTTKLNVYPSKFPQLSMIMC